MVQEMEVIRLLESMLKGADQLVDKARGIYDAASNRESDDCIIREALYSDLQYFKGYKQGISQVLQNLCKYYFTEVEA